MNATRAALALAAASLGALHSLLGPDHYLPFIAIGRAQRWTLRRTLLVTLVCSFGHVTASVVIALVAALAGLALTSVAALESWRGSLAAWLLVGGGVAYAAFGLWRGLRRRRHAHRHTHLDGVEHAHEHGHEGEHAHLHAGHAAAWTLFAVLVLGPCKPLIALLLLPAAAGDWAGVGAVTAAFAGATAAAMLTAVATGWLGLRLVRLRPLEFFAHALAGVALALSGVAVLVLGL